MGAPGATRDAPGVCVPNASPTAIVLALVEALTAAGIALAFAFVLCGLRSNSMVGASVDGGLGLINVYGDRALGVDVDALARDSLIDRTLLVSRFGWGLRPKNRD